MDAFYSVLTVCLTMYALFMCKMRHHCCSYLLAIYKECKKITNKIEPIPVVADIECITHIEPPTETTAVKNMDVDIIVITNVMPLALEVPIPIYDCV